MLTIYTRMRGIHWGVSDLPLAMAPKESTLCFNPQQPSTANRSEKGGASAPLSYSCWNLDELELVQVTTALVNWSVQHLRRAQKSAFDSSSSRPPALAFFTHSSLLPFSLSLGCREVNVGDSSAAQHFLLLTLGTWTSQEPLCINLYTPQ